MTVKEGVNYIVIRGVSELLLPIYQRQSVRLAILPAISARNRAIRLR